MSKKITKEEFMYRFKKSYPDCDIEVIEYTAISNPCKVKCAICGKEHYKRTANKFLCDFGCCNSHNETKLEKIKKALLQNKDFTFIKKLNKDYIIIKHNICGNEYKRNLQSVLRCLNSCPYCNLNLAMIPIEEVQERLNEQFNGEIQILDYKGQLKKNHYRCLKCGLIFIRDHISMTKSRGCPKCDKQKSNGEKLLSKILQEHNICFKEQIKLKELPLYSFDFGIYDESDNLLYFIEVQGEQHFQSVEVFRDKLETIQNRDNKKREYCKQNNIPLYELIWKKGKFLNLDILPL